MAPPTHWPRSLQIPPRAETTSEITIDRRAVACAWLRLLIKGRVFALDDATGDGLLAVQLGNGRIEYVEPYGYRIRHEDEKNRSAILVGILQARR